MKHLSISLGLFCLIAFVSGKRKQCGPDEEYRKCGPVPECQKSCDNLDGFCTVRPIKCHEGCYCKGDEVRLYIGGPCIPRQYCCNPYTTTETTTYTPLTCPMTTCTPPICSTTPCPTPTCPTTTCSTSPE